MTRANFVSGVGGANTPAFLAYALSAAQSIAGAIRKYLYNNLLIMVLKFLIQIMLMIHASGSTFTALAVVGKYFVYATVYGLDK